MEIIELTKIKKPDVIKKAIKVLKKGGLVVYPTETVYGLGVDATNQKAIDRLLQYKARREGKPLSVAVANLEMAKKYAKINQSALNLFNNFLPGPITVICHGLHKVAKGVESEQGTLGLRLPDYPLVLDLIRAFGQPITATSANASNQKRPYKISDIFQPLSEKQKSLIDLVLDAGELPHREPSTVVDATMDDYQILRQGSFSSFIIPAKAGIQTNANSWIPDPAYDQSSAGKRVGDDTVISANKILTQSEEETIQLGKKLIDEQLSNLKDQCLIFALTGDLGTGKTQLTKGIAQGLKIKEPIVSPTFNLVREYNYQLPGQKGKLYHLDTWRMFDPSELDQLGLAKMIKPDNVVVIEWADKIERSRVKGQGSKVIEISLEHISQNERQISLSSLPSISS